MPLHVVVTGSAGAVGQPVCRELSARGHHVQPVDRRGIPGEASLVIDLTERKALGRVFRGADAVIHLAAEAHDVGFHELLEPNVIGLFNVMDAAREEGVKRVVLASSIQVVSRRDRSSGPIGVSEATPSNHYALTKLWAEQMGAMYSRCFDLSVIAVRIAWMVRDLTEAKRMADTGRQHFYLSPRDVGRFFALAVEAPEIPFAVVYAIGPDGCDVVDTEPARRLLGFEARDRFPEGLGFRFP